MKRSVNLNPYILHAMAALILFAMSAPGFADATSRFTPTEHDVSMIVLKEIIGDWISSKSATSVTPLLSGAMHMFNMGILVFATAIFGYAAIVGTLQSAHDGQLLGKQWSTVWVPIRFSAGIALLIPTASGFCLAQYGLLWILSNGVGLASSMTQDAAGAYVSRMGNLVSVRMLNASEIEKTTITVLGNELCVAALNKMRPGQYGISVVDAKGKTVIPSGSTHFNASNSPMGARIQWGQLPKTDGGEAPNVCGEAIAATSVANNDELALLSRYGQANGILAQSEALAPLARKAMTFDEGGKTFITKGEVSTALRSAALDLRNSMADAVASNIAGQTAQWTEGVLDTVNKGGWFSLGTWYFQLGRLNGKLNELANSVPSVSMFRDEDISSPANGVGGVEDHDRIAMATVISMATAYFADRPLNSNGLISAASPTAGASMNKGASGWVDNTTNAIFSVGDRVDTSSEGFFNTKDSALYFGYDPTNSAPAIIQLKNVGDWIITGVYTAAGISIFGGDLIDKMPQKKGKDLFDKSISKSPESKIGSVAATIFSFTALALLVFGIILAFWLPMLPFINWVGGLIGWVISVLEMLVAAPIWIAAHLHPEGEGMASRHAASGYMIVLELLLRPVLMVFGFIVAVIIVDPLLNVISWMYFPAFSSMTVDSSAGLITLIMKIIIYAVICWMVINFAFKAITSVPTGVMKWIGGMAGHNSEMAESLGENARHIVVSGAHQVQGATRAGISAGARRLNKSMANAVPKGPK